MIGYHADEGDLMRTLLAAALVAVTALVPTQAPICRAGSALPTWSGSPAELAQIEAVYQAEYARSSGRAFPLGAVVPSPWTETVACTN